jgi:transcriptional regulator with XRE-family HTH domain
MANRTSPLRDAAQFADWLLRDVGREFRVARLASGKTQRQLAATLGVHHSHVSRVEHGHIRHIGLPQLSRHAAALGLKPWLRFFPVASRPLDEAQLRLWAALRERLHPSWQITLEAPMPQPGDLRAADVLLTTPTLRCMIELITRLADLSGQTRSARLKLRDIRADRLILVVAANETNRRALRAGGPAVTDTFPVGTREALERLAQGHDPGGDALILLRPMAPAPDVRSSARN